METEKIDSSLLQLKQGKSSDTSVKTLLRDYRDGNINLRPNYQRNEVINRKKASGIIESAILGIPIPPIYIFKDKNGKFEVIDGQQRLISLFGFLGQLKDVKTKLNGFKLVGLEILTNLNGKDRENDFFKSILNDKILDFTIKIFTFEEERGFDPSLKYEIFERLNKNPFPIKPNSFELWNCIYLSDFTRAIKEIVNSDDFKTSISRKAIDNPDLRMDNENDVLRFITIISNKDLLKDRNDISNKLMFQEVERHFLNKTPQTEVDEIKKSFIKILKKIKLIFDSNTNLGKIINDNSNRQTVYPNLTALDVLILCFEDEDDKFLQKYRDEISDSFKDFFKNETNRALIQNSKRGLQKSSYPFSERVNYLKENTLDKIRKKYNIERSKRVNIREMTHAEKLLKKQNGICPYCKNQIKPTDKYEIDHLTPIDEFGTNDENNLAILHVICNREKSNKLVLF